MNRIVTDDHVLRLIARLPEPVPGAGFVQRALHRPLKQLLGPVHYSIFELPVGRLFVAFDDAVMLSQIGGQSIDFEEAIFNLGYEARPDHAPAALRAAVESIAEGASRFDYPVDVERLKHFQQRVLAATREIPRGEIRSYGWIAGRIGSPQAVRAVGTALARNPIPILIPCHRVVRSDRALGEYSGGGPAAKARILRWEGVAVRAARDRFLVA